MKSVWNVGETAWIYLSGHEGERVPSTVVRILRDLSKDEYEYYLLGVGIDTNLYSYEVRSAAEMWETESGEDQTEEPNEELFDDIDNFLKGIKDAGYEVVGTVVTISPKGEATAYEWIDDRDDLGKAYFDGLMEGDDSNEEENFACGPNCTCFPEAAAQLRQGESDSVSRQFVPDLTVTHDGQGNIGAVHTRHSVSKEELKDELRALAQDILEANNENDWENIIALADYSVDDWRKSGYATSSELNPRRS